MNEQIKLNPTNQQYINNVFGKNINARLGPINDNVRAIFAQGSAKGSFFKIGYVNVETLECTSGNENDLADCKKVVAAIV